MANLGYGRRIAERTTTVQEYGHDVVYQIKAYELLGEDDLPKQGAAVSIWAHGYGRIFDQPDADTADTAIDNVLAELAADRDRALKEAEAKKEAARLLEPYEWRFEVKKDW